MVQLKARNRAGEVRKRRISRPATTQSPTEGMFTSPKITATRATAPAERSPA